MSHYPEITLSCLIIKESHISMGCEVEKELVGGGGGDFFYSPEIQFAPVCCMMLFLTGAFLSISISNAVL